MQVLIYLFCFLFLYFSSYEVEGQNRDPRYFRKGLWYRVNLQEKINLPFFRPENEISKFIIEATKEGKIQPYSYNDLKKPMSIQQFIKNISIELKDINKDSIPKALADKYFKKGAPEEYYPKQIYIIEIKNLFFFNVQTSQLNRKIEHLTLFVPAEENPKGIDAPIATFAFEDLKRLFSDSKVKWFESGNQARYLNFADALERKFYQGRLVRYQNPKNDILITLDYTKSGLIISERAVLKLMEYTFRNYWLE